MEKPTGSYIGHFSNLAKLHGGINLAQGVPGYPPPAELVEELNATIGGNFHQYPPGNGNHELVRLIAGRYGVDAPNVLVVQGATEGLSLLYIYIMKLIGADFAAASFEPAYESYSQLPRIFGQRFVLLPLNSDGSICFRELAAAIAQNGVRLLFVGSPGNPYGKVLTKDEVEELLELSQKLNFYIVFDAVYDELYFNTPPYIPTDRLNDRLFVVGSFSKALCITGWRIGYIMHHSNHAAGLHSVHDYTGLCAPSLMQQALVGYLQKSAYAQHHLGLLRQNIALSFMKLKEALLQLGFVVPSTDGGCFIWAQLPSHSADGFAFAANLYEQHKVAVVPGEHFSPNSVSWVRFNIARPVDEIEAAAHEIAQFIESEAHKNK